EPYTAYTAVIHWGDGQDSAGTVNADFSVTGSHTYAEEGVYSISVTITDDSVGTTSLTTATATVSEGVISFTPGTDFSVVEGNDSGTQTVAHFSDTGVEPYTAYTAVIHWGDGQDSAGTVNADFSVTGSHTYAEEGVYSISVTITDDSVGTTSLTTATATVSEGVISFTPGTDFSVVEGNDSGTQTVAHFSDTGVEPYTAYTAMIHWGDGQDSAGTVNADFSVTGSHTYAEEGVYSISVTITDDSVGTTSLTTATATVSEGVISFTPGTDFSVVEGNSSGTQTVAHFSDTGVEPYTAYTAMIHWGDGQDSAGTVNADFSVTGSHTYAEEGVYSISVTITDDSVGTTSLTTATAT